MKDLSTFIARQDRSLIYPKKRPSPHHSGIQKNRLRNVSDAHIMIRRPTFHKEELQWRRQAQILALRRDGIYIEEEYRGEICFYMHEMEVCRSFID